MFNSSLNYTALVWDAVRNLNWMQELYWEEIPSGNRCICPCSLWRTGNSNICILNYLISSTVSISKQKKSMQNTMEQKEKGKTLRHLWIKKKKKEHTTQNQNQTCLFSMEE